MYYTSKKSVKITKYTLKHTMDCDDMERTHLHMRQLREYLHAKLCCAKLQRERLTVTLMAIVRLGPRTHSDDAYI